MAERADHDRRRSGSFSKPHARLRAPEEEYVCSRRRRSRADRKLARGPGDLRERHGDLVTRRIPAAAPGVAESSTCYFRQSDSRGEGGIAVKPNFSRKIDHEQEHEENALLLWNATDAWLLQNNEFVRCGEALPAGSTHLLERPLPLDGDRALHFLAFDLPRLRDAFDVRTGEGVRLPEIATAQPAFELRLAGTLSSVTGELMCSYGDRASIKALAKAQDQFVFRDPQ